MHLIDVWEQLAMLKNLWPTKPVLISDGEDQHEILSIDECADSVCIHIAALAEITVESSKQFVEQDGDLKVIQITPTKTVLDTLKTHLSEYEHHTLIELWNELLEGAE